MILKGNPWRTNILYHIKKVKQQGLEGPKKAIFLYAIRHERNYLMAAGRKVVLFELGL